MDRLFAEHCPGLMYRAMVRTWHPLAVMPIDYVVFDRVAAPDSMDKWERQDGRLVHHDLSVVRQGALEALRLWWHYIDTVILPELGSAPMHPLGGPDLSLLLSVSPPPASWDSRAYDAIQRAGGVCDEKERLRRRVRDLCQPVALRAPSLPPDLPEARRRIDHEIARLDALPRAADHRDRGDALLDRLGSANLPAAAVEHLSKAIRSLVDRVERGGVASTAAAEAEWTALEGEIVRFEIGAARSPAGAQASAPEGTGDGLRGGTRPDASTLPVGTTWSQISVRVDGDVIHATLPTRRRIEITPAMLGLVDRRRASRPPSAAWHFLVASIQAKRDPRPPRKIADFARSNQAARRGTGTGRYSQHATDVRRALKALFPTITGDPLPNSRGQGWYVALSIEP
jgi:hypothetical protein